MPMDFYDVLGASADVSSTELKRAYRAQVREYHPDVNDHPDGDEQFKLIRKAHDVLSDPAERKDYDRMGHREYVDKRLEDLPPLTVFPEAGEERTSESASETTVDSAGSVRSDSSSTQRGTGSSTKKHSTSRSASSNRSSGRSTSRSSSSGRNRSDSTQSSSSRSTSTSQSRGNNRSAGSTSTGSSQSSASNQSTSRDRSANSSGTGTSGRSPGTTSAGTDRSESSWDDVTETTRSGTTRSSTTSAAARRRRGLRRWYGVVLLSLLTYLGGVGTYAAPYAETLSGLATEVTRTPLATLTAPFPLPSPTAYVLETATIAASGEPGIGLLFVVGAVALPLVVLTAVAQFGHGSAWIYAVASLGPVVPLAAARVASVSTAVALLGLVLLPLFSGLGFLVDVGRYLYATR